MKPIAIFLVFILAGCGGGGSACGRYQDCDYEESAAYESRDIGAEPDDVEASEVEKPVFENCTEDCSGHEAGFQWAQDNDVTDASECGGNSNSFREGCESFSEEREALAQERAEEAAEARDEETY